MPQPIQLEMWRQTSHGDLGGTYWLETTSLGEWVPLKVKNVPKGVIALGPLHTLVVQYVQRTASNSFLNQVERGQYFTTATNFCNSCVMAVADKLNGAGLTMYLINV